MNETAPLNLHDFEERVVQGIPVPSFMEIHNLNELSCMSLTKLPIKLSDYYLPALSGLSHNHGLERKSHNTF